LGLRCGGSDHRDYAGDNLGEPIAHKACVYPG
jgi:hypothetical protein